MVVLSLPIMLICALCTSFVIKSDDEGTKGHLAVVVFGVGGVWVFFIIKTSYLLKKPYFGHLVPLGAYMVHLVYMV